MRYYNGYRSGETLWIPSCCLLSGSLAWQHVGILGTGPGTAAPTPASPFARSAGRFNGSCVTASSLHWLLLSQPGNKGARARGKQERRGAPVPRCRPPPPLTISVL